MSKSKAKIKPATKRQDKPAAKPKKGRVKRREMGRGTTRSRKAPTRQPATARAPKRSDDAEAFLPDPPDSEGGRPSGRDDLAELLAENFVESATRGNEAFEDDLERALPDEVGGPFVITDADEELADDVDASNPPDAEVAGLPTAGAGLIQLPRDEIDANEAEGAEDDRCSERAELMEQEGIEQVLILPFTLDLDGPAWELGAIRVSEHGTISGLAVFCRCLAIGCFALVQFRG